MRPDPTVGAAVNVYTGVFDVVTVREYTGTTTPDHTRLRTVPALELGASHNATTTTLHNELASATNPEENFAMPTAAALAVGDGATSPTTGDTALDNQVGTVTLTDAATVDNTLTLTYVIDSTELNDETLAEVAVTSSNATNWNRALLSPSVSKDSTKIVLVDVELTFNDA